MALFTTDWPVGIQEAAVLWRFREHARIPKFTIPMRDEAAPGEFGSSERQSASKWPRSDRPITAHPAR
jgi:hypothetical protein